MAEAFYPFVENGADSPSSEPALEVRQAARIAVYDDVAAAPRVVVIEPSDVRTYLEQITATVTQLAVEQGGKIPFTVIREIVENLIHAYFIEPTISILDGGNTIRFSDQGPGIVDKRRALQFGTTSATTEMKRYIRGVGSGLPYAQQWLEDKGGSLTVEDNIQNGTVVTVSLVSADEQEQVQPLPQIMPAAQGYPQQPTYPQVNGQQMPSVPGYAPYQQPYPAQQVGWQQAPWPAQPAMPQPWQQPGYPQQGYPQPGYVPQGTQPYVQQPYAQTGYPQAAPQQAPSAPEVSARGQQALEYLRVNPSVGPNDLTALYGGSAPTWSRELKLLESQGLIAKQGQKRQLTQQGRQYLGI